MKQIFKKELPQNILTDFLDLYCDFNKNRYVLTNITFRKYKFENKIIPFFKKLEEYYYKSKLFYLKRTINYKNFITVIRQICKLNYLPFTSKIKYDNSSYNIVYFIYPKKS